MRKIKLLGFFKKVRVPGILVQQGFRLTLMLVIFFVFPSISTLQLGITQPQLYERSIIEIDLPIEENSDVTVPAQKNKDLKVDDNGDVVLDRESVKPAAKVDSVQVNSLCDGIAEKWKLVPNPEVSGQYIICNSDSGEMASVSELNSAQNNYRVTHGLNALSINGDLCKIAGERAVEVAGNFSHSGFEAAVDRSGIERSSVGENIASGPLTAVQFVEWSWDKSPGHRANMLGDWVEGCGGVHDRFAVFIFAK